MSFTHNKLLDRVPVHLRQYVVEQEYDRYTPRDQAVWRYIMRKNLKFLGQHAHHSYLEGLEKTGISLDRIPDVLEMNQKLEEIGWNAVVVNGFIPPAAFMEFQANRILVISAEMRSVEHILYTPAPDIVHEAAGHAPIIADAEYAAFLQKFGEYGSKAIASKQDFAVYEAIRKLSIVKEFPNATAAEINSAEQELEKRLAENKVASEAAKLSRMHWWTVEYGLIGSVKDYKLYGAGLLSSVGESEACMQPGVKKLPMSIDCVNYDYDITSMQPQLFVTTDWQQLMDVLEQYADSMGFRTPTNEHFNQVIASEGVATIVYKSGLQVSGKFTQIMRDTEDVPAYIKTEGPSALAFDDKELPGHGTDYHNHGFGSPVGKLLNTDKPLEEFSDQDMVNHNIIRDKEILLSFQSGIQVKGKVASTVRKNGKLVLISFVDCQVKNSENEVLFQPDWGTYDMALGEKIVSVFSGTADKEKFNILPGKSELTAIHVEYDLQTKHLFGLYRQVARIAEGKLPRNIMSQIYGELKNSYPDEWLLRLEILREIKDDPDLNDIYTQVRNDLTRIQKSSPELDNLISADMT